MRISESFIKSTTKVLAIAGLAIVSSAVFAQSDNGSISTGLMNSAAADNTAISAMKSDKNGDSKGDQSSKDHSGSKGKGAGGDDKGGKTPPPGCVPEPASMLAMGLGAGFMALKRRRAAKNAA